MKDEKIKETIEKRLVKIEKVLKYLMEKERQEMIEEALRKYYMSNPPNLDGIMNHPFTKGGVK